MWSQAICPVTTRTQPDLWAVQWQPLALCGTRVKSHKQMGDNVQSCSVTLWRRCHLWLMFWAPYWGCWEVSTGSQPALDGSAAEGRICRVSQSSHITLQMSFNHDVIEYQVHVEKEVERWCNSQSLPQSHERKDKRSVPGSNLWPWRGLILSYFKPIQKWRGDELVEIHP